MFFRVTDIFRVYDDMTNFCKLFCPEDVKDEMEKLRQARSSVSESQRGATESLGEPPEEEEEEEVEVEVEE
jgi:hypothetical protein